MRPSWLRCWPTTPWRKWTRCWPTTARQARRTHRRRQQSRARCWPTRTGPDQDVFTSGQRLRASPPPCSATTPSRRWPASSATLDGLTAQGNVGCDQLLCNDANCTDVFTTAVDASGAISCAALTATGNCRRSHAVGQLAEHHGGGQRGPAELGDVCECLCANNRHIQGIFRLVEIIGQEFQVVSVCKSKGFAWIRWL